MRVRRTAIVRIGRVERLDTERTDDVRLGDGKSAQCKLGREELRCDRHGDWEVATELVIGARAGRRCAVNVLVNAATLNKRRVDVVVGVVRRVGRDVVQALERLLDEVVPLLVGNEPLLTVHCPKHSQCTSELKKKTRQAHR